MFILFRKFVSIFSEGYRKHLCLMSRTQKACMLKRLCISNSLAWNLKFMWQNRIGIY